MLALLLPIYIKFGSIKGRMVLIALCFIPGFLFGLLKEYFPDMTFILSNLKPYMFVAPFAGLLILWLSSLISTAIYQQKNSRRESVNAGFTFTKNNDPKMVHSFCSYYLYDHKLYGNTFLDNPAIVIFAAVFLLPLLKGSIRTIKK